MATLIVTQEDIDRAADPATPGARFETCPLANAARRLHPDAGAVSVSRTSIIASYPKHRTLYTLPEWVSRIVERYDSLGLMEPFETALVPISVPKRSEELQCAS